MSLLKLKSKKEPLYSSKSIVNFDEDLKETTLEPIKQFKEKSSLIINSYLFPIISFSKELFHF